MLSVDDCLYVLEYPKPTRLLIDKYFPIKSDSPKSYPSGIVSKIQLPNGVRSWSFSSSQYAHEEIRKEAHLEETWYTNPYALQSRVGYNARTPTYRSRILPIPYCYFVLYCGTW